MRRILVAALILSAVVAASQNAAPGKTAGKKAAPAAKQHEPHPGTPPIASLHCQALPPFYRSDSSKVLQEKIGPKEASPTGNSFFMMPHPVKYVVVHLTPTSSDDAEYPVKIITRYTDDTIYEPEVVAIVPKANTPITLGPLPTVPPLSTR